MRIAGVLKSSGGNGNGEVHRPVYPTISIAPLDLTSRCRGGFNAATRGLYGDYKASNYRRRYNCPLLQLTSEPPNA